MPSLLPPCSQRGGSSKTFMLPSLSRRGLSAKEQQVLDSKLAKLEKSAVKEKPAIKKAKPYHQSVPLEPERYSEDDAKREISLSEKELNALIAKNPETAKRVAIDLADDLVSVKLLLPVDEDFLSLAGKHCGCFLVSH